MGELGTKSRTDPSRNRSYEREDLDDRKTRFFKAAEADVTKPQYQELNAAIKAGGSSSWLAGYDKTMIKTKLCMKSWIREPMKS